MPEYEFTCVQCGKRFTSTRAHAQTCSVACRVAHGRLDGQREKRLKRVKEDIMKLFDDYEQSDEIRAFFARLVSLVDAVASDYTENKSIQRAMWDREFDL